MIKRCDSRISIGGALVLGVLGMVAAACGGSDGGSMMGGTGGTGGTGTGGTGTGGTGTGGTGTGGTGTGGSGGMAGAGGAGGGTAAFMAIAPCAAASDYMTGSTIMMTAMASYGPKCLKVTPGSTVTFMGDFVLHPLMPSRRGDVANNPIKMTATGTSAAFKFDTAGFFAYFCRFHGPADDGSFMAGTIWVTR